VTSLSHFIYNPHDLSLDQGTVLAIFADTIKEVGIIMLLPIGGAVFVAFFASFIQNGLIISADSIVPKLSKISVIKGIKRLFSMRSFMEFIKGIIKITLVASVCYLSVKPELGRIENLATLNIVGIINTLSSLAIRILLAACSVMMVIAILDFLYQKFEYIKSLRMTKQELKEEFKQSEGDPKIKSRLKQIRMERARKRMMAAVPEADVVIRNPEHYAVALKYLTHDFS